MTKRTAKSMLKKAGLSESHWGQIIISAELRGMFLGDDIKAATRWVTCACGKLDSRIPRLPIDGCPVDADLQIFGSDFGGLVAAHKFSKTAQTLIAIEKRAGEIIAEMETNP